MQMQPFEICHLFAFIEVGMGWLFTPCILLTVRCGLHTDFVSFRLHPFLHSKNSANLGV